MGCYAELCGIVQGSRAVAPPEDWWNLDEQSHFDAFFGADFRIGSMETRPLFSIPGEPWGEPGTGIQIAQAVQEMGNFRRCTFVTAP